MGERKDADAEVINHPTSRRAAGGGTVEVATGRRRFLSQMAVAGAGAAAAWACHAVNSPSAT